MYPNLNAEIARKGWSRKKLAEMLGARYPTIIEKMNGKYPFTLNECKHIKEVLNTDISIDVLFFTK